jgi:hypothetical protein
MSPARRPAGTTIHGRPAGGQFAPDPAAPAPTGLPTPPAANPYTQPAPSAPRYEDLQRAEYARRNREAAEVDTYLTTPDPNVRRRIKLANAFQEGADQVADYHHTPRVDVADNPANPYSNPVAVDQKLTEDDARTQGAIWYANLYELDQPGTPG